MQTNTEEKKLLPFQKVPKRGKGKYNCKGIMYLWQQYQKANKPEERVTREQFNGFIRDLNTEIMNELFNGNSVKLSHKVGYLTIRKRKMTFSSASHLKIDWEQSKKYNKRIYHLNEHRNNYTYKFQWKKGKIPLMSCYSFIPLRKNNRMLAYILKNKPEIDYPEYNG